MLTKKNTIFIVSLIFLIGCILFIGKGITDYIDFKQVVSAGSGCPAQDGGKVTFFNPLCVLDTPAISPVTCGISCPGVTTLVGTACAGYQEMDTKSQFGTMSLAIPKIFKFSGGGTVPTSGMDYLYCGASPSIVWAVGIPSVAAATVKKFVDTYNYILAGFKN